MKTFKTLVSIPVDQHNYNKASFTVSKWTLVVAIVSVTLYLYTAVKSGIKRPSQIACSRVKKLYMSRTKDSCKVWQYFSLSNKGENPASFMGLRLKLASLTRKKFELNLEADSMGSGDKKRPITEIVIADSPLADNFSFSASVDSTELSNIPTGYFDCTLQAIIDTANNTLNLTRYKIYLDKQAVNSLRGIRKHIKRHKHSKNLTTYPVIEMETD